MSKLVAKGNDAGTGTFTLESPTGNADRTLVLPDEDGKILTDNISGKVITSGTATFTNSTNNIALTGVGSGVEVGDVISITGSVSNNKEFTIESITDANNIIVNAAHAGGASSKSLVNETVAVTVTLLCKWYLAPIGLGQGWVDTTASRSLGVNINNETNRILTTSLSSTRNDALGISFYVNNVLINRYYEAGLISHNATVLGMVPSGSFFKYTTDHSSFEFIKELR